MTISRSDVNLMALPSVLACHLREASTCSCDLVRSGLGHALAFPSCQLAVAEIFSPTRIHTQDLVAWMVIFCVSVVFLASLTPPAF